MRQPQIIYAIKSASWEDVRETAYWLGFNVLGGLMPIWGTFVLLRIYGQEIRYADMARHGEFALYSAAFLAPALQIIFRHVRSTKFVLGAGSGLVGIAGLVVAALSYAGIATALLRPTEAPPLNLSFVVRFSTGLLILSIGFALLVAFVENQSINFNIRELERKSEDELKARFQARIGEQ